MVNLSSRFFLTRPKDRKPESILDVPFEQYDPRTKLPMTIEVGSEEIHPLVSIQEIEDHLIFLSALHTLRASTSDFPSLCQASARVYADWGQHLERRDHTAPLKQEELPSLRILMCWHTHMLNPLVYARDVRGAYNALNGLGFPLAMVASAIKEDALPPEAHDSGQLDGDVATSVWSPQDIAEAVQRQAKFIDSMHNIGYLDMTGEKQLREIQVSIVLYHAWLDLMHATKNQHFLVPRLDIDLAWHTHQLRGSRYREDTLTLLGKTLDHNDNAGEGKIGDGLQTTARLWKERYGYDYQ